MRHSNGKKPSPSIVFLMIKEEAAKAGLTPGTKVRLDFDKARKLGRISPINSGVREVREKKGSVSVQWPYNGDISALIGRPDGTVELEIVEQSKTDGITFELP